MNQPLVSISCITYNHGQYVRQCLDSFLMQKTDFEIEILIHDDASTDDTQDIIKEYQSNYPEIIKPILQTENQFGKGVRGMMSLFNFSRAKGNYLALCEGDDYWTDPLKLQKQVNFLNNNEDYSICFHNVDELMPNGKLKPSSMNVNTNTTYIIQDLAKRNIMHTPSVMYRNCISEFPKWFYQCPIGDYPMHMLYSEKGKAYCIAETMAVYRIGSGIWSTQERLVTLQKWKSVLENLMGNFSNEVNDLLKAQKISTEKRIQKNKIAQTEKRIEPKKKTKWSFKKWF